MSKSGFHFNEKQCTDLCGCWKRPRDRKIAPRYLQEVERLIANWLDSNDRNPPTAVKEQIGFATDLLIKVEKEPALLEGLPKDFEKLLATVWLDHKYGEAYFQQHSEACRKDAENNTGKLMALEAFIRGWAPEGAPTPAPIKTEVLKLPPNYFQSDKSDPDFLRIVAGAADEIAWMLRGAKQWHNKSAEEELLFDLAIWYEHHFGKLPSAANKGKQGYASPFRMFLAILAKILTDPPYNLKCKLGAVTTRAVLTASKKLR